MSIACIYDCPTDCAFTENDVSNDNDESNGRKNGRFCGFATVRSMTDFQRLVNTMTYVRTALSIFMTYV